MVVRCWIEEPIADNDSLYQLDEVSGTVTLDSSAGLCVNRYTFVPHGIEGETTSGLASLVLTRLLASLDVPVRRLLAWGGDSGESPARLRVLRAKREREGWETLTGESLCLSQKIVDRTVVPVPFEPEGYDWRDGGLAMLGGPTVPLSETLAGPAFASLSLLARARQLSPSRAFIRWLGEKHQSLFYAIRGDLGERGLVLVTVAKIDVECLGGDLGIAPVAVAAAVWGDGPQP